MPRLKIEGIDEALLWSLKRAALERKLTLREWVISALAAQCLAELKNEKAGERTEGRDPGTLAEIFRREETGEGRSGKPSQRGGSKRRDESRVIRELEYVPEDPA